MIATLKRSLWVGIGAIVTVSAFLAPVVVSQKVSAVDYVDESGNVKICHRTNSVTNPYRVESPNLSAVDGVGNGDHFKKHQGPLVTSQAEAEALKNPEGADEESTKWGDIIPPVADHDGLNWTAEGQAMWNNGCKYVTPPELPRDAAVVLSATKATCDVAETLKFDTLTHATYTSGDVAGTAGPKSYSVTFTAEQGHLFADGKTTATLQGTLAGKSTAPSCETGDVLGDTTPTPTSTPTQLPNTAGEAGVAVVVGTTVLGSVLGLAAIRRLASRGI